MINKKQIIIAGPCSISSKEELESTIKNIYHEIDFFRCGIWKARTNVQDFKGIGKKGLVWLSEMEKKYHTPIAIEVGTPKHVEQALHQNLKVFWIGARTTVNPFYVQEICESIKGSEVEIWIKNPIHPDINLWIGAIERFKNVGIKKIKLIHRGFFSLEEKKYRNHPKWNLVKLMRNLFPSLEIICDPSHISGDKKLLYSISKKAISSGFSGLMIETHFDPENALSDAKQQVNCSEFKELLGNLKLT
tara:strand:+ start:611 stop:1351 length:741 start_codon:yes stop_codon:yes gene_type:complete